MSTTRVDELIDNFAIDFLRQQDWFDPLEHPDATVTIVGAGGIGSPTALCLSKLGIPNIRIIDFDEVEPHNIPNQMFALDHANRSKVESLKEICVAFGASKVETFEGPVQLHADKLKGIVITGLDNMDTRHDVWEMVKNNPDINLLIDGRLGGQLVNVLTIDPNDEDITGYYENFMLFPQEDAVEAPCTARGIMDVSFLVAAIITRQVRRFFQELPVEHTVTFNQETLEIDTSQAAKVALVRAIDTLAE